MSRWNWIILSFVIFLTGCTNVTVYKNPLSDLSASVTRTRAAIDSITQQAYQVNAKNLALQAALQSKRFGVNDLKDVIPPEYIKIRIHGLD
ncbi:MAG: hypothetical protein PHE55_03475, partial [Methylococcaceae bacterium]|nr:hypothetical protein [Methylococcaceae bacterium]